MSPASTARRTSGSVVRLAGVEARAVGPPATSSPAAAPQGGHDTERSLRRAGRRRTAGRCGRSRVRSATSASSRVLPVPGSPSIQTTPPGRSTSASASSRPTIGSRRAITRVVRSADRSTPSSWRSRSRSARSGTIPNSARARRASPAARRASVRRPAAASAATSWRQRTSRCGWACGRGTQAGDVDGARRRPTGRATPRAPRRRRPARRWPLPPASPRRRRRPRGAGDPAPGAGRRRPGRRPVQRPRRRAARRRRPPGSDRDRAPGRVARRGSRPGRARRWTARTCGAGERRRCAPTPSRAAAARPARAARRATSSSTGRPRSAIRASSSRAPRPWTRVDGAVAPVHLDRSEHPHLDVHSSTRLPHWVRTSVPRARRAGDIRRRPADRWAAVGSTSSRPRCTRTAGRDIVVPFEPM